MKLDRMQELGRLAQSRLNEVLEQPEVAETKELRTPEPVDAVSEAPDHTGMSRQSDAQTQKFSRYTRDWLSKHPPPDLNTEQRASLQGVDVALNVALGDLPILQRPFSEESVTAYIDATRRGLDAVAYLKERLAKLGDDVELFPPFLLSTLEARWNSRARTFNRLVELEQRGLMETYAKHAMTDEAWSTTQANLPPELAAFDFATLADVRVGDGRIFNGTVVRERQTLYLGDHFGNDFSVFPLKADDRIGAFPKHLHEAIVEGTAEFPVYMMEVRQQDGGETEYRPLTPSEMEAVRELTVMASRRWFDETVVTMTLMHEDNQRFQKLTQDFKASHPDATLEDFRAACQTDWEQRAQQAQQEGQPKPLPYSDRETHAAFLHTEPYFADILQSSSRLAQEDWMREAVAEAMQIVGASG